MDGLKLTKIWLIFVPLRFIIHDPMKRILLLTTAIFTFNTYAQLWFDIGAKGGYGTGFLINKTLNKDNRLSVTPGSNYFYGGKLGINFGEEHTISLDFSYNNNSYSFLQTGLLGTSQSYKYTINYSAFTFAPLYKHTSDAQYLEIGPEFSFVKNASVSDMANPLSPNANGNAINPHLMGAVFGFGGYIIGNQKLSLSMGLRFHYYFTNLTSSSFSGTNYPLVNYPDITTHASTNPLAIQVLVEVNYSLAQLARASCGKRVALISF